MPDDYGIDDAALEQRIAELDDDSFDALVARTRPPRLPKGNHVPQVGNTPSGVVKDAATIAAAEAAGDWQTSFALKSAQLSKLMHKRTN
jgi:hypothetical protein